MDNAQIIQRFGSVESSRTSVEANWDAIRRFVAPYRGSMFLFNTSEHSVEWGKREIYDDTAINAAKRLAANLQTMTSPNSQWFQMRFRDKELNAQVEAREWLESCGDKIFAVLQDSNFNLEANETYTDLAVFSTAGILEEAIEKDGKFEKLEFTSVPVKELYFEPGHRGVHCFYRQMFWEPSRIVDRFGIDEVPESVKELYQKGEMTKKEIIFCIWPREGVSQEQTRDTLAPLNRPFGYRYVLRDTAETLGEEGGYYEMPAFVPRWNTSPESMWGDGPSQWILSTVLTTNELVRVQLKSAEKLIDPPMKANEMALLSTPDLSARKLNIMRDIEGIQPLLTGAQPHVGDIRLDDQRRMIREAYHIDQLGLKESPAMTATEVQVRYEMMQRELGAMLARLQSDFLDRTISRTFGILMRAGVLDPEPQVVLDYANADGGDRTDMDIVYLGPLARAQRMDEVASIERLYSFAGNFAEVAPDMLDNLDHDEVIKGTAASLSVPASYLRTSAEVQTERDKRQNAQKAMMEAETAKAQGEAGKAQAEAQQLQGAA